MVEPAGDREQRVAHRLEVEPPPVHPPVECVLGIDGAELRTIVARLLIGAREHDPPMERLERPSLVHERAARWSSSSGWVGGSLRRPKSPGVATRAVPKWCSQTRLTSTRAVRGLS